MNQDIKTTAFAGDGHPDEDHLLLALERELPANEAARVEQHLGNCWSCRARFDEMQRGILAFVEYREKRYLPSLPVSSDDTTNFRSRLRTALSDKPASPFPVRIWRKLTAIFALPKQAQWVSAVAVMITLVILWVQVVVDPATVSANEFLARAVAAQNPPAAFPEKGARRRVAHQRLQIRRGQQTIVRDFAWTVGNPSAETPWNAQSDPTTWESPMTAQAFATWRSSVLGKKEDKVQHSGHLLTLATTASEDLEIKEAWMVVRDSDFHPVEQHLRFTDDQQLDFTELGFQISDEPSGDRGAERQSTPVSGFQASAPPKTSTPVLPPPVDLEETELQLRYTLFINQWDLGEDLVIGRASGQVTLTGTVSSRERENAMRATLNTVPNVQLFLDLPSASSSQPVKLNSVPANDATPLLKDVLEKTFVSREERLAFVDHCLAASDLALSHAWALKRLVDKYDEAAEQLLKPESDRRLHEIFRTHLAELNRANADLQSLLELLPPSTARTAVTTLNWRTGIVSLFSVVQQQDRLVARLVVGLQTDGQNLAISSADFRSAHSSINRLLEVLKDLVDAPPAK